MRTLRVYILVILMVSIGLVFTFQKDTPSQEFGSVVEIYDATDSDGHPRRWNSDLGSWEYPPDGFTITIQERPGEPIYTYGDNYFQFFIVQSTSDPNKYAVGLWDKFYGLFIQPAHPTTQKAYFAELPLTIDITTCWAPTYIELRRDGVAVKDGESVSFTLDLTTPEEEDYVRQLYRADKFWALVWSGIWESFVASAVGIPTFQTDGDGRVKRYDPWTDSLIDIRFPAGWGAITQRESTKDYNGNSPTAYCAVVKVWHKGESREVKPDEATILDFFGGELTVNADPGDHIRVGTLDDAGEIYQIDGTGSETITNIPLGRVSVVCYRGNGDWDPDFLPLRQSTTLEADSPKTITFPSLTWYNPVGNVIAGYVYEYMAEPLPGAEIWALNCEWGVWAGHVATTDGNGFWSVIVPPQGLGGDLHVRDSTWGTVPIFGLPCSDVVMGGHIYSPWIVEFRPEPWFSATQGHPDLPLPPWMIIVKDNDTDEEFPTTDTDYGGWMTVVAVPKYKYIDDPLAMCILGPQLKEYSIWIGDPDVDPWDPAVNLRSQPFENAPTIPGWFRASGYYPERKLVVGSKISGDIVDEAFAEGIDATMPEAARVGIEHGEVPGEPIRVQYRGFIAPEDDSPRLYGAELVNECEYCRCSPWLRPNNPLVGSRRGYCPNCGITFGFATAMDCRTHYISYPLPSAGDPTVSQRVIEASSIKGRTVLDLVNWYRQVNYQEVDAYLSQTGPGQPTNAPRWVTQKPILARMNEGTFVAGTTSAGINAAHPGDEASGIPPAATIFLRPKVRPKVETKTENTVTYQATFTSIDSHGVEVQIELDFTVPAGLSAKEGDIGDFPDFLNLSTTGVIEYEEIAPSDMLLITKVDNIEVIDGDPTGNYIEIISDVPAAIDISPPLSHQERTPFTITTYIQPPGVYYYIDNFGHHFRVRGLDTAIQTSVAYSESPWVYTADTLNESGARDIAVFKLASKLYYTWATSNGRHLAISNDDGRTAEEVINALISITWSYQRAWQFGGVEYILGLTGGTWKCTARCVESGLRVTFPDGSNESIITSGARREAGWWGTGNGFLYADLPQVDGIETWRSKDLGYTWELIREEA